MEHNISLRFRASAMLGFTCRENCGKKSKIFMGSVAFSRLYTSLVVVTRFNLRISPSHHLCDLEKMEMINFVLQSRVRSTQRQLNSSLSVARASRKKRLLKRTDVKTQVIQLADCPRTEWAPRGS
jgi:ABC-type thiamine transport system ATPase subunit